MKEDYSVYTAKAYCATSPMSPLASTSVPRRWPAVHDVQIDILFCGFCHSDLHQVRNEWSGLPTVYPCVPGHEIVGRVAAVGSAVTKFKPGELAAVGCLVDTDRTCQECRAGLEQFCPNFTLVGPRSRLDGRFQRLRRQAVHARRARRRDRDSDTAG
jgi:alcohol dehydrogenase (NADP+)